METGTESSEHGFLNGVKNRLSAISLLGYHGTVHTSGGEIGEITGINIVSGKIRVKKNSGTEEEFQGRKVADIDTALSGQPKK